MWKLIHLPFTCIIRILPVPEMDKMPGNNLGVWWQNYKLSGFFNVFNEQNERERGAFSHGCSPHLLEYTCCISGTSSRPSSRSFAEGLHPTLPLGFAPVADGYGILSWQHACQEHPPGAWWGYRQGTKETRAWLGSPAPLWGMLSVALHCCAQTLRGFGGLPWRA